MRDLEKRLINAIRTDANIDAVRNLHTLYKAARNTEVLKRDGTSYSEYETAISERIKLLEKIEQKSAAQEAES